MTSSSVRPYFYFAVEQFFYVATVLRPGVHDPDLHGFKIAVRHHSTDADQRGHPGFNLVRVLCRATPEYCKRTRRWESFFTVNTMPSFTTMLYRATLSKASNSVSAEAAT